MTGPDPLALLAWTIRPGWGQAKGSGTKKGESVSDRFDSFKGQEGGRIWPNLRVSDRIDATIAHEYEELHAGGKHADAVKNAARTELPISDEVRRLNRARAR